jgi:CHAT domain-containing protein/pimeloyl-ACP methyl ester carboxylesterase
MKTIKVLGQSDERLKVVEYGKELKNFLVSDAVQFSVNPSSANYHYISNLKDDEVVELIFVDNIRRWVTVAELEEDYKYSLSREGADVIEIPSRLPTTLGGRLQSSRGAIDWPLKGLRVLKYDPVEKRAGGMAETWDNKLMPAPGLYRFDQGISKPREKLDQPRVNTGKPILLFLHGIFSSTQASFEGLPKEAWGQLSQQYGEQIFGYDHYTLSESPIQNALDLVHRLPENAVLHLVTHSRGGLIGELLSRCGRTDGKEAFDEIDLKLVSPFVRSDGTEQDLMNLSNLLRTKNIRVERFVRIACPARGTTLASGRIDRWLELVANLLSKVMEPAASARFAVLTDLLLDLKKQSTNPETMPGLAAMLSESGFIRMLNRPDVEVNEHLCVIAGDVEKNDVLGRLALFFADLFDFEDHDLVVQTRAMYGGAPRKNGLYFLHKGIDVNHFHYFSGSKTAEKITEALISDYAGLMEKGFRFLSEAYRGEAMPEIDLMGRSYQRHSSLPQPVAYILPGIMGTHLAVDGLRIWLNLFELARGKILDLQISNRTIRPHSLVAIAYANLIGYLSPTHEVIPFPYDWRVSVLDEAERFGKMVEAKLKETKQPIRIVGHSMGGLVARAMINLRPDVWKKICERDGSRFLMLGTPNRGSHKIARLILGQDKMLRMLAMLDVRNSPQRILEIISRFPGLLQMLPVDDKYWDFLDANTWNGFANVSKSTWVKPVRKDLDEAKKFQDVLNSRAITADDPILYIAGSAPDTPVGLDLNALGETIFLGTHEGDGTVTWQSGILPELEKQTWYMNAPHGDMANHEESFAAIYDLLQEGQTERFSTERPQVARSMLETYILPEEPVEMYPSQVDLEQSALGTAPTSPVPAIEPIKVSVAHGNLSFCNNPVAVGHFEGEGLYSAEKTLDYHLSGWLSLRLELGLYPGQEGTVEILLNENGAKPGGAVIVGLGKVGELSPQKLAQVFATSMREYGVKALENGMIGNDGGLAISTVLIGAGGSGLSIKSSIDAILTGVTLANRSFARLTNVHITEIQFIELYMDKAILAVKALRAYAASQEYLVKPLLQRLGGGWQRIAYDEALERWNRIYVREDGNNFLTFSIPTDRARSEEARSSVQRRNFDRLITQAVKNPHWNQNLATTMFELMIPNRLKESFRDLNNIVLALDEKAARYPWELLYDRRTPIDSPLVIQVGLIRQFSTASFQERVNDEKNNNILVIGNPAHHPPDFANLPGAELEANTVVDQFNAFNHIRGQTFSVEQAIRADSTTIMSRLFSKDYRVLHLAGHGVYDHPFKAYGDKKPELMTGMVLGEDVFLTANEIKNKMNIPELVFINCCHLGKLGGPNKQAQTPRFAFNEFAASLSQQLIEMGVKAVVAAGWAVDDMAAATFARTFYSRLLDGYQFGEAVRDARRETYLRHKDTNTWAAYQCYGNPAYQLINIQNVFEDFVDIEEARLEIRKISGMARTTSSEGISYLQDRLVSVERKIKEDCPSWLEDSALQEALGEAFGEASLFDRAIQYYEAALKNSKCAASIKAIEQLANLRIRMAVETFETDPGSYEISKSIIEAQIKSLKSLMQTIVPTAERWSMIGSGYKRLAQISSSKSSKTCDQALAKMESAYRQAWTLTWDNAYPLTNVLAAKVARLLRETEPDKLKNSLPELVELTTEAARLAEIEKQKYPADFWASIGVTDVNLISYIVNYMQAGPRALSEELFHGLLSDYIMTWRRYGSARELHSIIGHYSFLSAALSGIEKHKRLASFLTGIVSSLKIISE